MVRAVRLSRTAARCAAAVALAYALAVRQDVSQSRALRVAVGCGFVLASSLHIGAELLGLR